ncbi:dienelactone hydrolase family protein [Actinomadura sp. HBU206391]|uniref:dienelactone hydrolase family protein n=1 Tax=Actinomadura sp. HBU206391 TaxID=2731692 RepID=UPI00165044B4|nr:dienelactone hydrolase family protein [Actinomadura sp. HBU206391]MBC6458113.1 dienelactone hydrolase family protein [Actinomadura sp. HBU206391]
MSTRTESVTVEDGTFDLPIWLPESGRGPGLLLVQEIFGLGPYIREVAEDLAALGYVVAAPDLFWRLEPGYVAPAGEEGLTQAVEMSSRFEVETGVADLAAALDHLAGLPELSAGVGALGFCLGGTMAYLLAAKTTLGALVSFYGSGVPDSLNLLPDIGCPVQFHFGGSDPYIPREQVAMVEQAVAGLPNVEIHVQEDGGHAFHNRKSAMFHQPEPAARAWALTETFLARHLPV